MILQKIKLDFRGLFKSPESRFMLSVGVKVMISSLFIHIFIFYSLLQLLRFNFLFFKTQSKISTMELETFINYAFSETFDILGSVFVFHIFLFLIGCYIGWVLLRPFHTIATYSVEAMDNINASYQPEAYSNYNLLTRFSEFFFVYARDCRMNKKLKTHSIPPQFAKVHKPKRDIVYFVHFSFLLVIVGIVTLISSAVVIDSLISSVLKLAIEMIPNAKSYENFFLGQANIFNDIYILIIICTLILYGALAFHLYDKMSGAAFGIFSTMRSFMKGNYSSRVHLLGYNHVREYTRKLNQYLNLLNRELEKDKEE